MTRSSVPVTAAETVGFEIRLESLANASAVMAAPIAFLKEANRY